jgi:hypothetical protein
MIRRPRRSHCSPLLAALLLVAALAPARAQGGYLVQGVFDAELWKTDSGSALLARNHGRPGALARLGLWGAVEPVRDVVFFGELQAEAGPARSEPGTEVYLNQLGVRWSPSDLFTVEAGKVKHVVGLFATRRLSFRNPLVGAPDGYSDSYPVGLVASGTLNRVDYRVGVLSLPLTRDGYVPAPGVQYRPAMGLGFTPTTGLRIGVSGSVGSYLNPGLSSAQLRGREWCDYRQRLFAADLQLSRGYFEANAEAARGSYEVPGAPTSTGYSGYLEMKYTFAPRFYLATRLERNDYPFISPLGGSTSWVSVRSAFSDAELGGGYRLSSSTLLKLAVRADRWTPSPNYGAPQTNGYAVVTQLSRTFDLVDLARGIASR